MSVDEQKVVDLYRKNLTMQAIGERLGISRARVHQILKAAGVETGYRYTPKRGKKSGKAYMAFRLDSKTRAQIDRLAKEMKVSRTAVVALAIEQLTATNSQKRTPGQTEQPGGEGTP